ncbi:hypothetical protein BGX26_007394, partial [Mortierella sp. AD094]
IEAHLVDHPIVREAVVLASGDGNKKHLIAYVIADSTEGLPHTLRSHLSSKLPEYMIPAAFVQLDVMPLTPTGKLNRYALPEPDSDAFVTEEYEAPQGAIECALAKIWEELLMGGRVGRHDNFFMLGGHSLLTVKLAGLIQSRLGFSVKLKALFQTPTIAQLSYHITEISDTQEDAFSVLLALKPEGDRLPLFCVHPVFGLGWSFRGLSKHMHSEQPIYALQARGIDGDGAFAKSVEDMSSDYLEQIRQVQPHGPYHLLGWSFGGSVVHCMAVQLTRLGEEVALLALMDSTPDYSFTSTDFVQDFDASFHAEHLARSGDKSTIEEGRTIWKKAKNVIRNSLNIARQHLPSVCTSDIVFFQATESPSVIDPSIWAPFTHGKVEVHKIGCEHLEMDKPKPMAEIGHVLAAKLEGLHHQRT